MSELRQALCCECGNLRTFREGYAPRNWIGEGHHHNVEWHRESHEAAVERLIGGDTRLKRSRDYWVRHADPFERYTFDLKCQPCGQIMKHALVAPPPAPGEKDPSEAWDHGWDSVWDNKQRAFVWRRRAGWQRPEVETRRTAESLVEDFEQLGVRVYWRGLKGDRAVSICQYLDDGAWVLTLDPESEDDRRYTALVSAWDAFLGADEHTWYVYPATDEARPYRGIAYEGRSPAAR